MMYTYIYYIDAIEYQLCELYIRAIVCVASVCLRVCVRRVCVKN